MAEPLGTPAPPPDHLTKAPAEVMEMIMQQRPVRDLLSVSLTCRYLHSVAEGSDALQDLLQFKDTAVQERTWRYSEKRGLAIDCLGPQHDFVGRLRLLCKDHSVSIFNSMLVSPRILASKIYERMCPARKMVHRYVIYPHPHLWHKDISQDSTCLRMQITKPPSTRLTIKMDNPRDGSFPGSAKGRALFRDIQNDNGITFGDIRHQAEEFLGQPCSIRDTRTEEDEQRYRGKTLFLTEDQVEWVENACKEHGIAGLGRRLRSGVA